MGLVGSVHRCLPWRGEVAKPPTSNYPGGSKTRVTKAGAAVRANTDELEDLFVINVWRAAHKPVLNTFQSILRNRTRGTEVVVAQRHKRKRTIFGKLRRFAFRNYFSDAREFIHLIESGCQKLAGSRVLDLAAQETEVEDEQLSEEGAA